MPEAGVHRWLMAGREILATKHESKKGHVDNENVHDGTGIIQRARTGQRLAWRDTDAGPVRQERDKSCGNCPSIKMRQRPAGQR